MAATPSPPSEAALARFLAEASGAQTVETTGLELLAGGAIQQNWGFTASFSGGRLTGAQPLVLRCDSETGIPSSLGRIEEFAVLKAVYGAGVTVPEPLFACGDPSVIGKPFFVMRRLTGTAQGRVITAHPALDPVLPQNAYALGSELALIQTIKPPRRDLDFLSWIDAAVHIASFRTYLDNHPNPRPVLEWAIRWLETHVPEPLPPVLCHRDFRTGNYLLAGPRLTGILDWEFAGWGDPDEDIGWFCCKGWRFARLDREAGGIADRTPFYEGYEARSGRRLEPERVFFWEVLANVRWAMIALQQSDRVLIGGARDLSTAIIGRRAGECELELLLLLDPDRPPTIGPPASLPTCARDGRGPDLFRDRPSGFDLLELGRELLLDELLPLLPRARHRDLHLLATAIAITRREVQAGAVSTVETLHSLAAFYDEDQSCSVVPAKAGTHSSIAPVPAGMDPGFRRDGSESLFASAFESAQHAGNLLRRFASDLRNGAFETSGPRQRAARAILWAMTISRLRESNPQFLAANGFGE